MMEIKVGNSCIVVNPGHRPGLTRVFDAKITKVGRKYFSVEVEGITYIGRDQVFSIQPAYHNNEKHLSKDARYYIMQNMEQYNRMNETPEIRKIVSDRVKTLNYDELILVSKLLSTFDLK